MSLLPMRLHYFFADVLIFPFVFHVLKYRRRLVRQNLALCFPERSEEERARIECDFYRWFADYIVETIKEMSMSRKEMMRRITFEGIEEAEAEMEREGRSFAFLYLGHFCNWEWVASLPYWSRTDTVFGQIYHPLHSEIIDRLFLRMRGRFGALNIPMKDTLRTIMSLKREGKKAMIGFISDQSPKWEAMHFWTTFLRRETSFFTGAEKIGRKVGASFYYADITRPRRGHYHCVVRRLEVDENGGRHAVTEAYVRAMERSICASPHLWLWTHNRWKRTREDWERFMEAHAPGRMRGGRKKSRATASKP